MLSKNIRIMWLVLLFVSGFWLGTQLNFNDFNLSALFGGGKHIEMSTENSDDTISAEKTEESEESFADKIFAIDDSKVLGIEFYMTSAEMKKILGNPIREELSEKTAGAGDIRLCYYDFGTIQLTGFEFDEPKVNGVTILKSGYLGPRNIKVGDSVSSVLKRFPYKPLTAAPSNGDWTIYNEYGQTANNYAYIRYQQAKVDEICYIYENFYCMRINVKNDLVESIELYDASII